MSITRSAPVSQSKNAAPLRRTTVFAPWCMTFLIIGECAVAVWFSLGAEQGQMELARNVIMCCIPVVAVWTLARFWEKFRVRR